MKTLIDRLEAALGDAHDPVKVALVAGDVRALIAAHKALHEAAGAFLTELESPHGDWPRFCETGLCGKVAMRSDGDQVACDEHQAILVRDDGLEDLSYAGEWRALRAALKEQP